MKTAARLLIRLARRFILSRHADGFLSLISWVSMIGVALGVTALIVVTSVINGFEGEIVRAVTRMHGDVLLYSVEAPVGDPAKIIARIKSLVPETRGVMQALVTDLMVSGPRGAAAGGILEGSEVARFQDEQRLRQSLRWGKFPDAPGEVTLGSSLAEKIGAVEGSKVRLTVPFAGESGEPRFTEVTVVGAFSMGMHDFDSKYLLTTLPFAQQFLGRPGKVSTFKIMLPPTMDARAAGERLLEGFVYPFRVKPWTQINKNLFAAIQLEKAVIAVILTAIILVAAFNVVSTLMMVIHDKTKEIAILKAMGFRPSHSFALFSFIGTGIGIVGMVLGLVGGLGMNRIVERSRWLQLPADIYYISFLPVAERWSEIFWILFVAGFLSFASTLYPALQVMRKSPLEGLRYD